MPRVRSTHAEPVESGANVSARELWVRGVVQGVGFRPFVYGLAQRHGVDGWVRNTSAGVQIVVEGEPAVVESFVEALPREAPPRSFIASLEVAEVAPEGEKGFRILESAADPGAYQLVSPDIALCPNCRRELLDPTDRRHGYPFINCTDCGPRFTIIESLPYDRARTTMRHFPLCPECRREYEDPADRRFHAEPNACPVCGPRTVLLARRTVADPAAAPRAASWEDVAARGEMPAAAPAAAGAGDAAPGAGRDCDAPRTTDVADDLIVLSGSDGEHPQAAVDEAAGLLRHGRIVAIKGLGGFHLACDATDEHAVQELKRRKGRPHKPLAVMFADLDQMRQHCRVSTGEAELLQSPEHPIVLLEWRGVGPAGEPLAEVGAADGGPEIAAEVAVRQRYLGCMLPYTPLHLLLLRAAGRPLVMTSGNLAEEPIVTSWGESGRLGSIPDAYLLHDRGIRARYDDSVALVRRGTPRLVRRSRGYAPFPVPLPADLPSVLACGAELKNTFCLTRDRHAFISQHIGDLENLETLESFHDGIDLYQDLFGVAPAVIAFDLHPEYLATKYAVERLNGADSRGEKALRGVGVQHHHAHIVSCMTENGVLEPVIGVSLDGLGFGADGHLWGGELLVCDALGFRRVAHLEYLPLPGGSLAIRTPARTAAGWLAAALGPEAVERALAAGLELSDQEAAVVVRQVETGLNAPLTSSCGRLFDCVAALAGLRGSITYEGQAAIELEMVSRPGADPYPYALDGDPGAALAAGPIGVTDRPGAVVRPVDGPGEGPGNGARPLEPLLVRLAPLLEAVLADAESGRSPALIGSRLHATVAGLVVDLARRVRRASGMGIVALSGGVFQNRLLTDLCQDALEADGFRVLTHALVPANDGGLSLGQAVIAGYNQPERRDDPCA